MCRYSRGGLSKSNKQVLEIGNCIGLTIENWVQNLWSIRELQSLLSIRRRGVTEEGGNYYHKEFREVKIFSMTFQFKNTSKEKRKGEGAYEIHISSETHGVRTVVAV